MDWAVYGYVIGSTHRTKTLLALDTNKTPSQIAKELKISIAHASKTLRELDSKKIVKCMNPDSTKGRVYQRTNVGEEIIKYIKDSRKV